MISAAIQIMSSPVQAGPDPEMIYVKGGCYQMGDTFGDGEEDEKPAHNVCVNDIYIGKYEVTQGQWKAVMGDNPSVYNKCGDQCPVEMVSWNDVQKFIRKLNQQTGVTYRLPTEAEWEYAARSGGKKEKWAGTSSKSKLGDYAWYANNSRGTTHPVGLKKPNGLGIYDMTGNVDEWVQDIFSRTAYIAHNENNPIYTLAKDEYAHRVSRGGDSAVGAGITVTYRGHLWPGEHRENLHQGFRLARTP